jgi:hypothetical protein
MGEKVATDGRQINRIKAVTFAESGHPQQSASAMLEYPEYYPPRSERLLAINSRVFEKQAVYPSGQTKPA